MARKRSLKARLTAALLDVLVYRFEHGDDEDQDVWIDALREHQLTAEEINGFKVEDYINQRAVQEWLRDEVSSIISGLEYSAEISSESDG